MPIFSEILPGLTGWQWAYQQGETGWRVLGYLSQVAGVLNFILKSCLFVTVMMWVRWTLPRLRIDQVMTTCLKYCVPLAAFCFLGAVGWKLMGAPSLNDESLKVKVREQWVYHERLAAKKAAAAEKPAEKPAETTPVPAQASVIVPKDGEL